MTSHVKYIDHAFPNLLRIHSFRDTDGLDIAGAAIVRSLNDSLQIFQPLVLAHVLTFRGEREQSSAVFTNTP